MGTKMAPTYATLTLGFLETKLHKTSEEMWNKTFKEYLVKNWKRFLDDCFILWDFDEEHLTNFANLLNTLDPDNIQFTIEIDSDKISFLDILVIKYEDKIITDIFYKPTNTHQYLHFGSCHSRHTKRDIPYNLARRICTIVSEEETQKVRLMN